MAARRKHDPSRPFPTRPGSNVQNEFRDWVAKTGRPDMWEHHCATRPPPDQDFDELLRFEVPEKLRRDVEMASCPICCPTASKYYEGSLAWFPHEGVLRAIGRHCAASHFGQARHNAAVAKGKLHEAVERAENFLLDTLPRVAPLRDEVAALQTAARDIDTLRHAFWSRSSKSACKRLVGLGNQRPLAIEEVRETTVVDIYGKERTRPEHSVVQTFAVAGMGFLTRQRSVLAAANNTAVALQQVRASDQEEALQFICAELRNHDHLFEAEKLARAAVREVEKLREAIDEARTFLAPANLAALAAWSEDRRSGSPVIITLDMHYPGRVWVRSSERKALPITIPNHLQ